MLGPGLVEDHIEHARAMAEMIGPPRGRFLDLGTGAGIPGVVLGLEWPATTGTLLDSRTRPTVFLIDLLAELDLMDRLEVVTARAEDAARDPDRRAGYDLVVARGFASPAVTAECAVAFLTEGGRLAVSEPPDARAQDRWPKEGLAELGFTTPLEIRRSGEATVAILTATGPPPDIYPRPSGRPGKRPLW